MSGARARLPSVDRILGEAPTEALIRRWGRVHVRDAVRLLQEELRRGDGVPAWATSAGAYAEVLRARLESSLGRGLLPVFNLTGTLLHTNLGRAVVSERTATAGFQAAISPVALEYDLDAGERGDRDGHVEPMLCALSGAEAATVVNNNAAALVLVLNSLALGRKAIVSRGELIEIGGSFRLPEMMRQSGCILHEVGTTNRTHPHDYVEAIDDGTAVLLKVHPSNYRIEGFTSAPSIAELAGIADARSLPLCVYLGSGTFVDLAEYGLPHEPTPREVLADGADLVTFSGDKLLGSVQAGIIAGRADLVAKIKRNPLRRALRCDKVRLAMLRDSLTLYGDPTRVSEEIPFVAMLGTPLAALEARAERIAQSLASVLDKSFRVTVARSDCEVGSGALPRTTIESRSVYITAESDRSLVELVRRLRALSRPVIGRLHAGALLLDMRALLDPERLLDVLRELAPENV